MSMGELAAALEIDPANATAVVDDLESLRLARRRPHPPTGGPRWSRRRARQEMARRADAILGTPPPALSALSTDDLEALRRILKSVTARK